MGQMGFYYNWENCIGCKACQIACKDKNDLEVGVLFRRVYDFEGGKYPNPYIEHISISCNHCKDPKCVQNCPTGAMYKRTEDGLVLHDDSKCIGCRMCVWSCPYGAPQYIEETGKVAKCTGCADLLEKGEEPACVASCVMRAIEFGDIDELRKKYGEKADIEYLPDSSMTHPSITIRMKERR